MRQNKEDIGRLRVRNKELSEELSQIKKVPGCQNSVLVLTLLLFPSTL